MKVITIVIFCLVWSVSAQSQSKPTLKESGTFGFTDATEYIQWDKFLEDKNQLLLIGRTSLQLLDLTRKKAVETRSLSLPSLRVRSDYTLEFWQVSPDGKRLLVVGHPDARIGDRQAAWVWNLETGKRVAVLDQMTNGVRGGWWSKNGKTLITFDDLWYSNFTRKLGVTFWDGETFEYRKTIFVDNLTWLHLSDDGARFFAASGKEGNLLGINYVKDTNGVINVWHTRSGELEKTISVADANFTPKTREISVSPDDRYLLFVKKHKQNAKENRLLAWEMNGSILPKYELRPQPKIDDSRIEFSPDGKFFALDVGKNLQIYETATGNKTSELRNVELPDSWLSENVLFRVGYKPKGFFGTSKVLSTYDTANGQKLYQTQLLYEETSTYDYGGESSGSALLDDTIVARNPKYNLFVTQSDEYVRLFDSRTGELLQTVISPPVVYDKKNKPKLKHGTLVKKVKWSIDGKTLCVFNIDGRTVSLWELSAD